MSTPLLDVRNLRTVFGDGADAVTAVDDVSFSLQSGQSLGIIGESGSGKTVTAFSILRLLRTPGRIDGGSIRFEGEDLLAKSPREMSRLRGRRLTMILQDPMSSLNPVFRVGYQIEEAVRLAAGDQKISRAQARKRSEELLKMVRIPEPSTQARQYPHQMSGGMRQRVVSAIALAGNPRLLIADEPTTSLDVTTQLQFLNLVKELRSTLGFALIFISHDLGIIERVCDRVAVMYAGRIVETGSIAEVFSEPAHPYTRGLLRSTPDISKRVTTLDSIKGQPPDPRAWPTGCRFAPRCPDRMQQCLEAYPLVTDVSQGSASAVHDVACWLHPAESVDARGA